MCALSLLLAAVPAALFVSNLRRYLPPRNFAADLQAPRISVLIPARNEAENIGAALECVLRSRGVEVEAIVYDDASTDETAAIVRDYARADRRVRLLQGGALPAGWNGKQHACFQLAQAAGASLLLFLDADVRLDPNAIARCAAEQQATGASLLSGFPRLITLTWMERLLLPLIHFVLLGFLPLRRMRSSNAPAYAAGCGQFMLTDAKAYFLCGGHAAIRATRHDGLRLPKLFREHGLLTDICDLTDLASVRMYGSAAGVWNGLAKNATEGLGAAQRIVPVTALLVLGQVFPIVCVCFLLRTMYLHPHDLLRRLHPAGAGFAWCTMIIAVILSFLPRVLAAKRFHQSWRSAVVHPVGVLLLVGLQWYALVRKVLRQEIAWRGRS